MPGSVSALTTLSTTHSFPNLSDNLKDENELVPVPCALFSFSIHQFTTSYQDVVLFYKVQRWRCMTSTSPKAICNMEGRWSGHEHWSVINRTVVFTPLLDLISLHLSWTENLKLVLHTPKKSGYKGIRLRRITTGWRHHY